MKSKVVMGGSPSPDYPSPDLVPILPDLDLELIPAVGLPSPKGVEQILKIWNLQFSKKYFLQKILKKLYIWQKSLGIYEFTA